MSPQFGLNKLGTDPANPFRALAQEGREATAHRHAQPQLHDSLDMRDWLTRTLRNSIDESTARLQSGLAILASVGSTAPFIGLFGTVWGIYHALMSISAAGQATIDKVASPIGEALIMLIIFIITVPVMKHAVNVELPRASNVVSETRPQTVRISVDAQGRYFWNETPIDDQELPRRLKVEAARAPQADLHIRGDREVRYERVAQAMAAAQQAGMHKIGFITEPRAN